MATDTGYTLDQFLADTRATIKTKGVPSGLAEIREHLEKLLRNPELLKKHLGDPVPYRERTTIGHDPETDVHVLVHGREKGGKSVPHDHGPCWVIYGNYKNPTRMRRWRRLDDGSKPGHAELEERSRWVVGVREAGLAPFVPRVTLTFPALASTREMLFLVSGHSKQEIMTSVLSKTDLPATRAYAEGNLVWLVDRDAAPEQRDVA